MGAYLDSVHNKNKKASDAYLDYNDAKVSEHDLQKRAFLKALGTIGIGVFIWAMLPKKASALVFGSSPGKAKITTDVETLKTQVGELEEGEQSIESIYEFNSGTTFLVSGPKIIGTDPPERAASTQALIDKYISLGIPEDNILWNVVGESNE